MAVVRHRALAVTFYTVHVSAIQNAIPFDRAGRSFSLELGVRATDKYLQLRRPARS